MAHPFCETCRFWDPSTQLKDADPDTTGICRINPPVADGVRYYGRPLWPFTEDTDWCGRHEPLDPAPAP